MQNISIDPGHFKRATVTPLDANENLGTVVQAPTWTADAPLALSNITDGYGADVAVPANCPPGVYTVTVNGKSSILFSTAFTVTVAAQPASHFGFSFA